MSNTNFTPGAHLPRDFSLEELDNLGDATLCSVEFLWDDYDAHPEVQLGLGRNGVTKAMAMLAQPYIEFANDSLEVKLVDVIQFLERCLNPATRDRYVHHGSPEDIHAEIQGNLRMLDRLDVVRPLIESPRAALTADTPAEFKPGVFPEGVKPIASHVLFAFLAQFPNYELGIYVPTVHS